MAIYELLIFIFITAISAYFGSYLRKKAEQKAVSENIEKITKKVEEIRTYHKKALSEYDIKLENFKKSYRDKIIYI